VTGRPSSVPSVDPRASCSEVPVVHRRDKPGGGSGVRINSPGVACVNASLLGSGQLNRSSSVAPSPGSGNRDELVFGQLFDLEDGVRPLLSTLSKACARGRARRSRTTAGHRRRGRTDGTGARRHEAGGRPVDLDVRLHCSYSADSRSRPPRPSRHIRDTGPGGVRERRAPLTGVRYPLCYLGWSRLERALSGSAERALSRPPSHP
jgi:hypothetical protein